MKVTTGQVLKYTLLPGILPAVREMVGSGFGYISFFMAQVFRAARLLPAGHPYLSPMNMRRYSIGNVLGEAYRNLKFDRNHLDQVVIFAVLCAGFLLLMAQVAILGFNIFIHSAKAAMPAGYGGFFTIPNAHSDIAYIMLDRVFGIPGLFTDRSGGGTCVAQQTPCLGAQLPDGAWPFPFHAAFHDLLQFYSIGLLVVALIIFLYFIVAITVETAQTGTPFGRRFNNLWAPIRMVVALALLIPISYGLNGAQYLTLYAAKWGSNLATNGWVTFNARLQNSTLMGSRENLVAIPKAPQPNDLMQFYTVLASCTKAYKLLGNVHIDAYLVKDTQQNPHQKLLSEASWEDALDFYNNGDIFVVFGEHNQIRHPKEPGYVMPFCGKVLLATTDVEEPGSRQIQKQFYNSMIRRPWEDIRSEYSYLRLSGSSNIYNFFVGAGHNGVKRAVSVSQGDEITIREATEADKATLIHMWKENAAAIVNEGTITQVEHGNWQQNLQSLGWGGGGIWYNKIAQMNGAITAAAFNLPYPVEYPAIMEYVLEQKRKHNTTIPEAIKYRPVLADGTPIDFTSYGADLAGAMNNAYEVWSVGSTMTSVGGHLMPTVTSQNAIIDVINILFGTEGLFDMRNNVSTHPLAQLSGLGKSLVDNAVRNLGIAVGAGAGATLANLFGGMFGLGQAAGTLASMASGIAFMTLSIGFILYYVIPFLPFIFFFLAVGNWVKAVFEAMVGVPLWALAHIRIDGDGLPGPAALDGYFLIFEIFLRPLLIVFGLIAAVSVFAAQVQVLNEIFDLVVANLTGFDKDAMEQNVAGLNGHWDMMRSTIDYFFHTVIYAIIVYMMAMASFKLINLIPGHVMTWLGTSVNGFAADEDDGTADGLVRNVSMGAGAVSMQLSNAAGSLGHMFSK